MNQARLLELRAAAQAADDAYSAELVRVYGERARGDARYRYRHTDEACTRAADAKLRADEAVIEALELMGRIRGAR